MKRRFFTVAAATLVMGFGLQAQNSMKQSFNNDYEGYSKDNRRVEFFDGNTHRKVEVSEGLQVKKTGENSYVTYKEIKNQPSLSKNNYQFKLTIEGEWRNLAIGNGDEFSDLVAWNDIGGNIYEIILPEGIYDIAILGYTSNRFPASVFIEQILIDEDTEITANFSDAIYEISLAPVDVDNILIDEWAGWTSSIDFYILMHSSINLNISTNYLYFPISLLKWYTNDTGIRNKLQVTVGAYNETTGDEYFVALPTIENGIVENIVLQNTNDELFQFKQMINVPEGFDDVLYSYTAYLKVYYDFEKEEHGCEYSTGWSPDKKRDKNTPYSLYTNLKYNNKPQTGMNVFIMPITYDFYDLNGMSDIKKGMVIGNPMAINNNGEMIMNFFPKFDDDFNISDSDIMNIILSLGNNPLTKVWNEEEFFYEGYRTPILYHHTLNTGPETNPFKVTIVKNRLVFLGEFGEAKFNHCDLNATITDNENEIFNDNIHKLNHWQMTNADQPNFQIEVINDEVFAYGQNMVNRTVINFDVTKTDVNPPTLTMLRVIENEKVSMFISDVSNAHLEVTAGDFTISFEEFSQYPGSYYQIFTYDKKPDIKIFWSYDGETFNELSILEDESKFHLGYGNFFNVSLAPLAASGIKEGWITVKIVLTDEVGNSQVQVLDPLFYYGDFVGIDKTTLSNNVKNAAYPNPFTDNITIELDNSVSGLTYFEIYDIFGKIVHQQKLNATDTKSFSYNGKHLKEGVYFYRIYNQGNVISGKIVKE